MNDDEVPESGEAKIPLFLWITYITLVIGGLWAFYVYWNGSSGFLDRGYWQGLQRAAATTYPFEKRQADLQEDQTLID